MSHGDHFGSDEIGGRHLDWRLLRRYLALLTPWRRTALASLSLLPFIAAARLLQPWLLK